jgi:integrase
MNPTLVVEQYLSGRGAVPEYRRALTRLAAMLPELSAKAVNSYLRARQESVSSITVANERRMILTLWRWAWEEGLVDSAPRGVLRVKAPLQPVRAWSISECRELVKAAEKFFGKRLRCGADLGVFLKCWVVLAYETGARYGDIFSWRRSNISGDAIGWVTSKTGVVCARPLSDGAIALVNQMLEASPDDRILGWVCCRRQSFKFMRKLISSVSKDGSGKWLRRSAATHIEMQEPGKAQWFLAHKSPGMAMRHYLDQRQLAGSTPRPPSVFQ